MSSNLVIVAIPDQDDRVWRISSEKVPHLTLLFLGDANQVSNLDQIMLFVEHAASTSLKRFYLPVDHRGELGEDKADVLFFKKGRYDFAAVRDFRSLLLKDTSIKSAYDATQQFEAPKTPGQSGQPWIPHLTLGYPTSPAKSLPDGEIANFYDVNFNRIAVWTGDFEGPEFLLKDYWDDWDEMPAIPMDVAMSDLQHFGTKGMHWGVRKEQLGTAVGNIKRRNADRQFKRRAKTADTAIDLMGEARDGLAKDLPAINERYKALAKTKGPNQNLNTLSRVPAQKAYKKEIQDTFLKHLNAAAESKTNPSGTKSYTIEAKSATRWKVKLKDVAHADISEFEVEPVLDSDGYIIDVKLVEEAMTQTTELGEEFLAHLSEEPWSNFTKADYTLEQWHAACLIHTHDGDPTSKSECKLPVKTPDGALNRNGVHAAAAALAGARGGLKGVSDDQKKTAAGALRRYYAQLDEDAPESLAQSAVDLGSEFILEHFGIKGMHWGQRKSPPTAVSTSSTSVVPHGTKRKTKIEVEGGENHPAHDDAIRVAEAKAKLKKSGTSALSNQELREMANRLQLENQVAILTSSKGKQFVSREFETTSKQLIKRGTKQGAKRYGPTVAKKAGKAAATAATIAVL